MLQLHLDLQPRSLQKHAALCLLPYFRLFLPGNKGHLQMHTIYTGKAGAHHVIEEKGVQPNTTAGVQSMVLQWMLLHPASCELISLQPMINQTMIAMLLERMEPCLNNQARKAAEKKSRKHEYNIGENLILNFQAKDELDEMYTPTMQVRKCIIGKISLPIFFVFLLFFLLRKAFMGSISLQRCMFYLILLFFSL